MSDHYDVATVAGEVPCDACGAAPGVSCRNGSIHAQRIVRACEEIERRRDETRAQLSRLDADVEGRVTLRTPLPVPEHERGGVKLWRSRY